MGSGPVPNTPKNSWSDVDSLKRYLSMTTARVQNGVMVQPAIWPIAAPPSNARGTCVKSPGPTRRWEPRSEEHTSELQSHVNLVCRLLLEKNKKNFNVTLVIHNDQTTFSDRVVVSLT